jgi:hypothetical protein
MGCSAVRKKYGVQLTTPFMYKAFSMFSTDCRPITFSVSISKSRKCKEQLNQRLEKGQEKVV